MAEIGAREHQIDLGHLMAIDPLHHFSSPPASRLGFLLFAPPAGLVVSVLVFWLFLFSYFVSLSCKRLVRGLISVLWDVRDFR